jgi:AraC family transcriptional regulator
MGVQISSRDTCRVATSRKSPHGDAGDAITTIEFHPAEIVRRRIARWRGLYAETVQVTSREPFEYRCKQASHLLIAAEQAARYEGETLLEGLPRSTLRDFSRKLTFVPAGRSFTGWQNPRLLSRWTYIYMDPRAVAIDASTGFADAELAPRLFFESRDLWETILKLKALIGDAEDGMGLYAEALSVVLAHELMRLNEGTAASRPASRGGLAAWQHKRLASFIEEHLADNVSLAALADVAQLSPYHFLRAFKQSFGEPPHRYCVGRRIERAKALLADPRASVTGVALAVGFATTSAFSATFRRVAGHTPSDYRRGLE